MINKLKEFVELNNEIVGACSGIFSTRSAARISFLNQVVGRDNEVVSLFKSRTNKYLANPFYENDVMIFNDDFNEGYMHWNEDHIEVFGYSISYDGTETERGLIKIDELVLWLENAYEAVDLIHERMFALFQTEYDKVIADLAIKEEERIRKEQEQFKTAKEEIQAKMKQYGITKEDL